MNVSLPALVFFEGWPSPFEGETGGFPVEAVSTLREEIATPSKCEGTPPKNGGSR